MSKKKTSKARRGGPRHKPATTDRHILYQLSVQAVDAEIDFVDETFRKLRQRRARRLREDFCGTAATSCEWVRRRPTNVAVGLDLDQATLDWGAAHNIAKLKPAARGRVTLLNRDVAAPGRSARGMDCVLAMNFSYWIFSTRPLLRAYFKEVRRSLVSDGIFFLDIYGGCETTKIQRERRSIKGGRGAASNFTYIWDQAEFDPITNMATNHIHFRLADGTYVKEAFTYRWRVWNIVEIRELLEEAGFRRVTVYWEGDDEDGEGNGDFQPTEHGEACECFISYIVAER